MSAAMTLACHAALRLPQADRVLFKLCKHYALKVRVDFDPLAADIHFPYGRCRMKRQGELLLIHGQAASPEALAQVRHVMDEHLALMARDPQLRLDWQDAAPIPLDDLPARLRTTTAQYGIWVAQQVDAHEPGFWTGEAVQLDGMLDAPALREAIHSVLMQARGLHVRIRHEDDLLWQWPQPPLVEVAQLDFSTEANPAAAAQTWMQHSLARPCDVSQDVLLHTAVLRLGPQRHLWFLQVHHIVLDGFGYQLVQQAVAARYSARVSGQPLPALPLWDPRPVIEAEARYHAEGGRAADQAFWREQLRHVPAPAVVHELHDSAHDAWRRTLHLDAAQVQALQAAAQQTAQAAQAAHPSAAGAARPRTAPTDWTPWLLTALTLWLARQSGQRHLCVGLPVMNRLGTPALGVPCMAMNIVPVMLHVPPGASLAELVAAMAAQLRQIRPHLYYRYGWIRGDLGLLESGTFLFNQAINLMPFERRLSWAGLHSRVLPQSGGPVKDLNLALVVLDGRWQLTLEANPLSYPPERAQALADDLAAWLVRLADHTPAAALDALLPELGAPSVLDGGPLPEAAQPLLARLMTQVQARPTHPALHWPDDTGTWHTWDYATLNQRIDTLAQALHPLLPRTEPDTPEAAHAAPPAVAVMLERSPEAVLAMWALWRLGAVYVPLDPHGPPQRRQAMLEAARPALVLTRQRWLDALPGGIHLQGGTVLCLDALRLDAPEVAPTAAAAVTLPAWQAPHAQTPAALLFTSGSTGRPKGVLIGHGALAQFVSSAQALYAVTPADRVLQFAPLGFDASLEELLMSLCHGATLVLRNEAMLESPHAFARSAHQLDLSVLDLPTAYWQVLAQSLPPQEASSLAGVRLVLIGGEAALPEALARWRALLPGTRLLNTYGPTEASIIVSTAALAGPQADGQPVPWQPGQPVPIGRPRPGVRLAVVDRHGWPVAEGRSGELVIQGEALALGYLATPSVPGVAPGLRPVQEGGFTPLPLSNVGTPGTAAAATAGAAAIPHLEPPPQRAYRTGDRVRLHNGQLLFLGRGDGQVKISGLRIEPAEVENALLALPGVQEAAVLAEPLPGGGWRLVACVAGPVPADADADANASAAGAPEEPPIPACGLDPRLHAWRHALLESLPAPAVPDVWLTLPALPRNPHGKIDRRALHAQRAAQSAAASNGTGLAHASGTGGTGGAAGATGASGVSETTSGADHTLSALLTTVLRAWESVLGPQATPQALGPESHFFELGGKSLQAIQVAAWLSRELGREVAMSLLFRHPRAAALAEALAAPTAHEAPRDQDAFAPQLTLQHGPADAPVLWCLHPAEGLAWSYLRLARHLPGLTLHGLQIDLTAMETLPADFDALVTHYLGRLRAAQPRGPYHLLGWSLGGALAQALAARLQAEGDAVAGLYLLDAYPAESWQAHPVPQQAEALRTLLGVLGDFDTAADPPERLLARLLRAGSPFERLGRAGVQRLAAATLAQTQAFRASRSRPFGGPVVFYQALHNPPGSPQPAQWQPWLDTTRWACLPLACSHDALSDPAPMAAIAADLAQRLGTDFHPTALTTA